MSEVFIELVAETRSDGVVSVKSDDLPLFNVLGSDEEDALNNAMALLPEYLSQNVPEFVELRTVRSAKDVVTKQSGGAFPAHLIATMTKGDAANGSSPST